MVGDGIVGIEIDGAAKFLLGSSRVPCAVEQGECEGSMRFRRLIVEFDRLLRRSQSARVGFAGRHESVFAQQVVGVRKAHVSRSVTGIVNNGLGEVVDGLSQSLWGALFPVKTALEIELFRVWVGELTRRCGYFERGRCLLDCVGTGRAVVGPKTPNCE